MGPVPNIGFGEWLFLNLQQRSEAQADKVAQIFADDGTSWTFSKLFADSVHAAVGLPEIGVRRGDIVALVLRNSHQLFSFTIGCLMADIQIVPMVAELSAEDFASGFRAARPTHILTASKTIPKIQDAIALLGLNPSPKILEFTDDLYNEIIAKGSHIHPNDYRPERIDNPNAHSTATYFSSGTCGPPKAVVVASSQMNKTVRNGRNSIVHYNGPMLNTSQCNWITWLFSLGRGVDSGRCRVFMNMVDMKRILDAIEKYQCESWMAPPRVILAAEKALDAYPGLWNISSLKVIISFGDSLRDVIHERLIKTLGCAIYQEYGSTEGGYVNFADVTKPIVFGSIGKPCLRVKLVDIETGEDILEPHRPGELYIHAKEVLMKEFLGDKHATADAFKGDWMPSGDLMYFDENGHYFVIERVKEIFKYNGYQISPSELEVFITQIPDVMETAVVGKPDATVGEYPTAIIVKRPGSELTADDVHNFLLKCNLADWQKLRGGVIFLDELPKTSSGKVVKRKLKDLVRQMI